MIIAIDGPAASGKTSTGRRLARRLRILCFDTGLTYRAVALAISRRGVTPDDAPAVIAAAEALGMTVERRGDKLHILVDGEDVTDALWTAEITAASSRIASIPRVRELLVGKQREAVASRNAVVVGRDIGTVVFPDADLKIYLDARADVRAKRRYEELRSQGAPATYEAVYRDVVDRDRRDTERTDSPLTRASDAVWIDTTTMTLDKQVEYILALINKMPRVAKADTAQ